MKKLETSKKLMRLTSFACVSAGLLLVAAKPAAARFEYCDWPTGYRLTRVIDDCKNTGTCITYETGAAGACASDWNMCAGCTSFTVNMGEYKRDGFCNGAFACVRNANATATYVQPVAVPGCATVSQC